MSEVKDGDSRERCKTSSGVDCSLLRAHACDGRCWSSRARAAQSSLCLQETRRASDAAAKPFRQLPRRYNFISLLCTILLIPPICLLIRRICQLYLCPSLSPSLRSSTLLKDNTWPTWTDSFNYDIACTRVVLQAMLLLRNCVTEHCLTDDSLMLLTSTAPSRSRTSLHSSVSMRTLLAEYSCQPLLFPPIRIPLTIP